MKLIRQGIQLRKILKKQYKVKALVCVDPMGLVIAGRIKKIADVKIIYASFEIFFKDEFFMEKKKILKDLEIEYSRIADAVIIQDENREKLLREANDFPDKTEYFHIPVSPNPIIISPDKSVLRKKLHIPAEKMIVVYSGSLQSWSGINEIIELFTGKLSSDFWLLVHSHHKLAEDDPLRKRLAVLREAGYQITFHDEPFYEFKDYAAFLSNCDIGIATYIPRDGDIFAGRNLRIIGLSSGKFSTYMMLGMPTVTTDNIPYNELNKNYRFGEVIGSISELPNAIQTIKDDYEVCRKGCLKIYDEILNPEDKINNFLNSVDLIYK